MTDQIKKRYNNHSFELSIRNKLAQRTNSFTSSETTLLKSLKHVDTNNDGIISFEQWIKAIEKIGVIIPLYSDLINLFALYDVDKDGQIFYAEFANSVFSNDQNKIKFIQDPLVSEKYDYAQDLIVLLRENIYSKGILGVFHLSKEFRNADFNYTQVVNFDEFKQSLQNIRADLNERDIKIIFNSFDTQKSGYILYLEFLQVLKGLMNEFRTKLVLNAFDFLNKFHYQQLSYKILIEQFGVEGNPYYIMKRRTKQEILQEFLDIFNIHHFNTWNKKESDSISKEEFVDFYSYLNPFYENDEVFMHIVHSAWNIPLPFKPRPYSLETENNMNKKLSPKKGNRNFSSPDNPLAHSIVEKFHEENPAIHIEDAYLTIRKQLSSRGPKGIIGILKRFMDNDEEKIFKIPETLIIKIFKEYRIEIDKKQLILILEDVDPSREGMIPYLKMLEKIRGKLNSFRKSLIEMTFKKFDRFSQGVIDLQLLKQNFSSQFHPEVLFGKKNPDEILSQFLETLEIHHFAFTGMNDPYITKDEFFEYFHHISSSIESDEYFEHFMVNSFKLISNESRFSQHLKDSKVNRFRENQAIISGGNMGPCDLSMEKTKILFGAKQNKFVEEKPAINFPCWPIIKEKESKLRPKTERAIQRIHKFKKQGINFHIVDEFRDILRLRGIRGILGFWNKLIQSQIKFSGSIDLNSFIEVIRSYRLNFGERSAERLFIIFDKDLRKVIDIDQFMKGIIGEMNNLRRNLVCEVFKRLDRESKGIISLEVLKSIYCSSHHPEVLKGKRTEQEEFCEFTDLLEMHHSLYQNLKSSSLDCEEFISMYNIVSRVVDLDNDFENLLLKTWSFDKLNIQYK